MLATAYSATLVGLAEAAVRESRVRVKSAKEPEADDAGLGRAPQRLANARRPVVSELLRRRFSDGLALANATGLALANATG